MGVLQEELDRLRGLTGVYAREIASRPKGTFVVRKFGRVKRAFLISRVNGKYRSKLLGPVDSKRAELVRKAVEDRNRYKLWLGEVKESIEFLKWVIRARKTFETLKDGGRVRTLKRGDIVKWAKRLKI